MRVVFVDEPPVKVDRRKARSKYESIAESMINMWRNGAGKGADGKGKWAVIPCSSRKSAYLVASHIRTGRLKPFAPYEVEVTSPREMGKGFAVYARILGYRTGVSDGERPDVA